MTRLRTHLKRRARNWSCSSRSSRGSRASTGHCSRRSRRRATTASAGCARRSRSPRAFSRASPKPPICARRISSTWTARPVVPRGSTSHRHRSASLPRAISTRSVSGATGSSNGAKLPGPARASVANARPASTRANVTKPSERSTGYGLYPVHPRALWNAASRADASMPEGSTRASCRTTCSSRCSIISGPTIQTGKFPPFRLLEKLGGQRSYRSPRRMDLQNRNPQTAERWVAFLELYDGTGSIKNLGGPLARGVRGAGDPGRGRW